MDWVAVGAVSGIVAFLWRIYDHHVSYLHIELRVDLKCGNYLTALTVVENRRLGRKKIKNALLLVGPEDEDPRDTMSEIGIDVEYTNDIVKHSIEDAKSGPGRKIVDTSRFLLF